LLLTRARDESGVAMILVVIVAMLMLAAAVLASNLTNVSLTGSGRHVRYERELHLAEEGIDQVLARLQADDTYHTTTATPPAVGSTPAEEKAWALAQMTSSTVAPDGHYTFVKPAGRNVVYAAGWDNSKAGPATGRVLKAEYLFSTYHPEGAILSGGDVQIAGNATVGGQLGDVHANGNVTFTGNAATVSGNVSATGSISVASGNQIKGTQTPGAPTATLPPVDPVEMWALLSPNNASSWYDLCGDGTARTPNGGAPCAGTVQYDAATATQGYRGWTWSGSTKTWKKDGSGEYGGVYFVNGANADIGKSPGSASNPWQATVITNGVRSDFGCETDYGDIFVSGSPVMTGFITGLSLVAGRDLDITGNPNQSFNGVLAAHEQVFISGNPTLIGSLLAESACDTPGSPVSVTTVSGSMSITYNDNVDVQLGSLIRTSLWLEL
jgi:formylmethanofuran dehydrogenase subunit C